MESDPSSGRPSTSRKEEVIDQVREKVLEDCRLTVQEIVAEVGISTGSVHSILTEDLNLRRVSAKFVPKLLGATEGTSEGNFWGHARSCKSWRRIYKDHHHWWCDHHHWWWDLGLWLRPRNQVSILAMEASRINTAKGSSASSQQCESDADLFCFVFFIPVASCITNTHQKARQLTRSTICRFYVAFEKLCEESGPTYGQQRIFSSTMTMPPRSFCTCDPCFSSQKQHVTC